MSSAEHTNVGKWERLASIAGGGWLLFRALKRGRGPSQAALASLGLPLMNRGLSGHCGIYNRLGLSSVGGSEGKDTMAMRQSGSQVDLHRNLADEWRA